MGRRTLTLITVVLLMSTACTTPYRPPEFVGKNTKFDGIGGLLPGEPSGRLDVLLVHGMCTHDQTWAKRAIEGLVASLELGVEKIKLEPASGPFAPIELYQRTLETPGGQLRINALVWSPLTTPLKRSLCYDQTVKGDICEADAPAYEYKRAHVNRIVKDGLMNDCLADALAYQGKSREFIVGKMQLALLHASATSGGRSIQSSESVAARAAANLDDMVLISDSLGSKIVLDSIDSFTRGRALLLRDAAPKQVEEAGIAMASRTVQVFLNANQIPVLMLADVDAGSLADEPRDVQALVYASNPLNILARHSKRSTPPRIIAFSDPNDLLSYPLIASGLDSSRFDITDVIVSNAPTVLGVLEMPTTAHDYTVSSRDLIACGNPRRVPCIRR